MAGRGTNQKVTVLRSMISTAPFHAAKTCATVRIESETNISPIRCLGHRVKITMLPFCSTFLCSYLCGVLLRLDFRSSNELLPITNKRTNIWCST